jgi:hypothetical protein
MMIGLVCAADLFNLWVWFEAMAVLPENFFLNAAFRGHVLLTPPKLDLVLFWMDEIVDTEETIRVFNDDIFPLGFLLTGTTIRSLDVTYEWHIPLLYVMERVPAYGAILLTSPY